MKKKLVILAVVSFMGQAINAQIFKVYKTDNSVVKYFASEVDSIIFEPDEHEWVDLGLPSGTLWATCNVGASSPEDYGDYFAWGETTGYNDGKTTFNWTSYKYCKGTEKTITKYCTQSEYGYNGFIDNLTELLPEDDAATVNWGENWQMPSLAQMQELINSSYTTTEWITVNGINGSRITSKNNGKNIFLPATGGRWGNGINKLGSRGCYWSSTLVMSNPLFANSLDCYSDYFGTFGDDNRYDGRCVRPVRVQETPYEWLVTKIELNETSLNLQIDETKRLTAYVYPTNAHNPAVTWESSNNNVAMVVNNGLIVAVAEGVCVITCRAMDGSGVYAECQVTVGNPDVTLVTGITLSSTSVELTVGDTSNLTATVQPANATNKSVTWSSSKTSVATVDQGGEVTANAIGTCTITCSAEDGSGVKAVCTVAVSDNNSNDDEVTSKITAQYIGGYVQMVNGIIQYNSQLNFQFKNDSSKDVVLKGMQLINGVTDAAGNFMSTNVTVAAGTSVAYTITIGLAGIQEPICRFTYIYNGKEFTINAPYVGI